MGKNGTVISILKVYNCSLCHFCFGLETTQVENPPTVDHPSADRDVDQQWDALKSAIQKACRPTETIGHIDWFDEYDVKIQDLFVARETPSAIGKMTLLLNQSRKNTKLPMHQD